MTIPSNRNEGPHGEKLLYSSSHDSAIDVSDIYNATLCKGEVSDSISPNLDIRRRSRKKSTAAKSGPHNASTTNALKVTKSVTFDLSHTCVRYLPRESGKTWKKIEKEVHEMGLSQSPVCLAFAPYYIAEQHGEAHVVWDHKISDWMDAVTNLDRFQRFRRRQLNQLDVSRASSEDLVDVDEGKGELKGYNVIDVEIMLRWKRCKQYQSPKSCLQFTSSAPTYVQEQVVKIMVSLEDLDPEKAIIRAWEEVIKNLTRGKQKPNFPGTIPSFSQPKRKIRGFLESQKPIV
jgi:hypothetical protein